MLKIRSLSKLKEVWKCKSFLGEGVLWVSSHNSIYFVDIKKKYILTLNLKTNKKKILKLNKEIGFLAHVKKYIFVLGLKSELRIVDIKSNKILKSIKIEKNKLLNRINDGKTDSLGRLWFGTMDNLERKIKNGSLYCLDKHLKLHKVDSNYYITNGPAFINQNNFFHTDSRTRKIYKIKINKEYKIIKKSLFLKFKKKDGSPDGMTVDKKKNIWICHFGGACISVYNQKGKKIFKISLPAKNITSCTFGGYNDNDLFVTSALKGMNKNEIKEYPQSGSLFRIKVNIKGHKTNQFKVGKVDLS